MNALKNEPKVTAYCILVVGALFLLLASLSTFSYQSFASSANTSNSASIATFGSIPSVDTSGAKSIAKPPIITNVGDNVYLSYAQSTPKKGIQIYFQKITNNGATVGSKTLISSGADTNTNEFQRIAATGSFVYITWQYNTVSGESILFRASADTGNTWGSIQNLSALAGTEVLASCHTLCAYPTIAGNGSLRVCFLDPAGPQEWSAGDILHQQQQQWW